MLNDKIALAHEHALVWQGKLAPAVYQQHWQAFLQKHHLSANKNQAAVAAITPATCPNVAAQGVTPLVQCGARTLYSVYQIPQQKSYYCGPASVQEILQYYGRNYSQQTLAGSSYLNTDQNGGTNWSTGNGYSVVANALTVLTPPGIVYNALSVNNMSESAYENDFTTDIDGGYPVDSGIQELPGNGNHLPGHPHDRTIQHWIAIRGYASYGSDTEIADSAANDTSVLGQAWAGVPAYSTVSSSTMYDLIIPYGIVW